jgi:hypothetical protein
MTGDWKNFDYDSIRREAEEMHYQHMSGERISGVQRQDSLEYWIAVVAWQRAKESRPMTDADAEAFLKEAGRLLAKHPMGSTRWR